MGQLGDDGLGLQEAPAQSTSLACPEGATPHPALLRLHVASAVPSQGAGDPIPIPTEENTAQANVRKLLLSPCRFGDRLSQGLGEERNFSVVNTKGASPVAYP